MSNGGALSRKIKPDNLQSVDPKQLVKQGKVPTPSSTSFKSKNRVSLTFEEKMGCYDVTVNALSLNGVLGGAISLVRAYSSYH